MAGKDGARDTYTSIALDIAEIETLMLVKEVDPNELQQALDKKVSGSWKIWTDSRSEISCSISGHCDWYFQSERRRY
jgi:hypothetical protein